MLYKFDYDDLILKWTSKELEDKKHEGKYFFRK